MKKPSYLVILLLLTMIACKEDSSVQFENQSIKKSMVPTLLDRSEKIQMGKEWDLVQNTYVQYKNEIDTKPNDPLPKLKLAQLFIKEARVGGEHGHYYPAALKVLDHVLAIEGIKNEIKFLALLNKAGVQLSLHEFSDAEKTGLEALALNQRNAQVYGVLVDANVELGNYKKAVQLADKMMSIKPDIRSYSRIAYLREIHGDVVGAKKALKLAVEAGYPGNEETAWAMLTLGELYANYGDLDSAEKIYKNILEMRPDYPFAVAALGDIAYEKGQAKEAEKILNEAMGIIPEVGFYISLARIYKDQGREVEFNSIMKEVFLMLEDDEAAGHNMSMEYASIYQDLMPDSEQALSYLLKEYEKRPKNIDINRMLAKTYQSLEDKELTRSYATVAGQTNSVHPDLIEIINYLN